MVMLIGTSGQDSMILFYVSISICEGNDVQTAASVEAADGIQLTSHSTSTDNIGVTEFRELRAVCR